MPNARGIVGLIGGRAPWTVRRERPYLWLRSDLGISLGDGPIVEAWADQSGNGYDATQGSSTEQPDYVQPAVAPGAYPYLSFDLTRYMVVPVAAVATNRGAGVRLYVVGNCAPGATPFQYFVGMQGTDVGGPQLAKINSGKMNGGCTDGAGLFATVSSTTNASATTRIWSVWWRPNGPGVTSDVTIYCDGVAEASVLGTAFNTRALPTQVYLGWGNAAPPISRLSGALYEVIVTPDSSVTADTRILRYLGRRYGRTVP